MRSFFWLPWIWSRHPVMMKQYIKSLVPPELSNPKYVGKYPQICWEQKPKGYFNPSWKISNSFFTHKLEISTEYLYTALMRNLLTYYLNPRTMFPLDLGQGGRGSREDTFQKERSSLLWDLYIFWKIKIK